MFLPRICTNRLTHYDEMTDVAFVTFLTAQKCKDAKKGNNYGY